MKIGLTINLGDYESMRIDSGEHDDWMGAATELFEALWLMNEEPGIRRFLEKPMWKLVKEQLLMRSDRNSEGGDGDGEGREGRPTV